MDWLLNLLNTTFSILSRRKKSISDSRVRSRSGQSPSKVISCHRKTPCSGRKRPSCEEQTQTLSIRDYHLPKNYHSVPVMVDPHANNLSRRLDELSLGSLGVGERKQTSDTYLDVLTLRNARLIWNDVSGDAILTSIIRNIVVDECEKCHIKRMCREDYLWDRVCADVVWGITNHIYEEEVQSVTLDRRRDSSLSLNESESIIVESAINPYLDEDEVLCDVGGTPLKRYDFLTLRELGWLNDEIINSFMQLLLDKTKREPNIYHRCWIWNSFFYEKLSDNGHKYCYRNVKRWSRRMRRFSTSVSNAFDFKKILVPVHLPQHWVLSVINICEHRIEFYDSLGSSGNSVISNIRRWVEDESTNCGREFDPSSWSSYSPRYSVPQQDNCSDCGVFLCAFAESVVRDAEFDFSASDMPRWRKRIARDLLLFN